MLQEEKACLPGTCSSVRLSLDISGGCNTYNSFLPPLCPERESLCTELYGCDVYSLLDIQLVCRRDHQAGICQGFSCPISIPCWQKPFTSNIFPGQSLPLFTAPFPSFYRISRSAKTIVHVVPGSQWSDKGTKLVRVFSPTKQRFQGNIAIIHVYLKKDPLANYSCS